MGKILYIIAAILEEVRRFLRAKEQREHEQEVKKSRKRPFEWFSNRFGSRVSNDAKDANRASDTSDRE